MGGVCSSPRDVLSPSVDASAAARPNPPSRPATPNHHAPNRLSIRAPATPDLDSQRERRDKDMNSSRTPAPLRVLGAALSLPCTPGPSQQSMYPFECPICLVYYKEIYESQCCKHYMCVVCAVKHVRLKSQGSEQDHMIIQQLSVSGTTTSIHQLLPSAPLDGVSCPTCSHAPLHLLPLHNDIARDRIRSYQESPKTRELFARREKENRVENSMKHTPHVSDSAEPSRMQLNGVAQLANQLFAEGGDDLDEALTDQKDASSARRTSVSSSAPPNMSSRPAAASVAPQHNYPAHAHSPSSNTVANNPYSHTFNNSLALPSGAPHHAHSSHGLPPTAPRPGSGAQKRNVAFRVVAGQQHGARNEAATEPMHYRPLTAQPTSPHVSSPPLSPSLSPASPHSHSNSSGSAHPPSSPPEGWREAPSEPQILVVDSAQNIEIIHETAGPQLDEQDSVDMDEHKDGDPSTLLFVRTGHHKPHAPAPTLLPSQSPLLEESFDVAAAFANNAVIDALQQQHHQLIHQRHHSLSKNNDNDGEKIAPAPSHPAPPNELTHPINTTSSSDNHTDANDSHIMSSSSSTSTTTMSSSPVDSPSATVDVSPPSLDTVTAANTQDVAHALHSANNINTVKHVHEEETPQ